MSADRFTVPPSCTPGDRVAIVAPAAGAAAEFPHVFELGLERIRETFDLEPVVYPTATMDSEDLAANPDAGERRRVRPLCADWVPVGAIATVDPMAERIAFGGAEP